MKPAGAEPGWPTAAASRRGPPGPARPAARPIAEFAVIVFATFASYWPALRAGFIWDDNAHVTAPALRSLHGLWRIWFHLGATQQYYPVLYSAFWLEHRLWGDAAFGYHLLNIGLHAAAAVLAVVALRRLGLKGAWLAGLLFAVHPAMAESVAWISEQKNTLSAVAYLLAGLAYLRFDADALSGPPGRGRRWGWYAAATALFGFAVLTKTVTASLPAALLVVFWWKRGRVRRRDVLPLLPWFVFGGAAGMLTAWVERHYVGASGPDFQFSFWARLFRAGRVTWCYLGHLAWPSNLMFFYPRWPWAWNAAWLVGTPALAGLLFLTWSIRRKTRGPLAALLFFVGTLFPALGFVNVYPFLYSYVADHFQYLASLGIFAAAASGAVWAAERVRGALGGPGDRALFAGLSRGALAVALAALGAMTWRECGWYRTPVVFYRRILEKNPGCWLADNNLGLLLQEEGRPQEAFELYRAALRLRPQYAEAHSNLGVVYLSRGKLKEARANFLQALRIDPTYQQARNNYGLVLDREGRLGDAIAQFRTAVDERPDDPTARGNLVSALLRRSAAEYGKGDFAAAISDYNVVLRIRPGLAAAENNLGLSYAGARRIAEAIPHYIEAIRLQADYADPHYNLGNALLAQRRYDEAMAQFRTAARLNPKNADAFDNYGACLYLRKRYGEAVDEFRAALRVRPGYRSAEANLRLALAALGGRGPGAPTVPGSPKPGKSGS
ncbi:MAG: tetratricopeptide repeat protein [Opitutaceae bacterium]